MDRVRMPILEHLEEFRQRLFKVFWALLIFFTLFLSFTIRFVEVGGLSLPYLWPDFFEAISIQILRFALDWYLPAGVEAVQLTPAEAIMVQVKISLFLAVLFSMPVIVYQMARFLAPGLYPHERQIILKITVPATLLFLAGVLFSHFFLIPFIFEFLYGIGIRIGLTPLASPDQVFDVVLLFFLGMGLAFQTPIIMWGLTALGVVDAEIWKRYWRVALVAFFVFGAVITPDGSGVTMLLVATPMTALYGVGYVMAKRTWEERQGIRRERRRPGIAVWSAVVILVAAVSGGYVYYNTPLFQPSQVLSERVLTGGAWHLDLPAYAVYAAEPLPGTATGAVLRATNGSTVGFGWTAVASGNLPVAFAAQAEDGPIQVGADGNLTVRPTAWTAADLRSLTLTATNGTFLVYTLHLEVTYDLVLRTVFRDGNGNGALDVGEEVEERGLLVRYIARPLAPSVRGPEETPLGPPAADDRLLLDRGAFRSLGSGWELTATLDELMEANATFAYPAFQDRIATAELTVDLTLTRTSQGPGDVSQRVWVRGQAPTDFVYSWFLDLRMGALYPVLEAP